MRPETKALLQNILKLTTEEKFSSEMNRQDPPSPDPFITKEVLDELSLDIEEVGEEIDGYFQEVESSIQNTSEKSAANPSPPKISSSVLKTQPDRPFDRDYHTDWELKSALENPGKPLEREMKIPCRPPPIDKSRGNKLNNPVLWTPALDRRPASETKQVPSYKIGKNNWEVETPYIER